MASDDIMNPKMKIHGVVKKIYTTVFDTSDMIRDDSDEKRYPVTYRKNSDTNWSVVERRMME